MARTRRPCPGCHKNHDRYAWRDADEVCGECKAALADYARMEQEVERLRALMAGQNRETKLAALKLGWEDFYLPRGKADERLGPAIARAIQAVAAPASQGRAFDRWGGNPRDGGRQVPLIPQGQMHTGHKLEPIELTADAIKAIRLMHVRIAAALVEAFDRGVESGRSFVSDMAMGIRTLEQIEETVAENVRNHRARDDRETAMAGRGEDD